MYKLLFSLTILFPGLLISEETKLLELHNSFVQIRDCNLSSVMNKNKIVDYETLKGYPLSVKKRVRYGEKIISEHTATPSIAYKFKDGMLLGVNKGEFIGQLVFSKYGSQTHILEGNIIDLFEYEDGFIVFTGLSHLMVDRGEVYFLDKTTLKPRLLHKLLKSPKNITRVEGGELFIESHNAIQLLDRNGALSNISCKK